MLAFSICLFKISYSEKRGRRFEQMVEVGREFMNQATEAVRKAGGPQMNRNISASHRSLPPSSSHAEHLTLRRQRESMETECRGDGEK